MRESRKFRAAFCAKQKARTLLKSAPSLRSAPVRGRQVRRRSGQLATGSRRRPEQTGRRRRRQKQSWSFEFPSRHSTSVDYEMPAPSHLDAAHSVFLILVLHCRTIKNADPLAGIRVFARVAAGEGKWRSALWGLCPAFRCTASALWTQIK